MSENKEIFIKGKIEALSQLLDIYSVKFQNYNVSVKSDIINPLNVKIKELRCELEALYRNPKIL